MIEENIFYHACPKEDTESILKYGLLKKKANLWKKSGGAIYLTYEPIWMNKSKKHDILIITLSKNFLQKSEIWNTGWQLICWENIPPQFIRKFKKRRNKNDIT